MKDNSSKEMEYFNRLYTEDELTEKKAEAFDKIARR